MFFKKKNKMSFDVSRASLAAGLTAALFMLVLSLLNAVGVYENAAMQMMEWHMFYATDVTGTITGMIEAFIVTYVMVYVFGHTYHHLGSKK